MAGSIILGPGSHRAPSRGRSLLSHAAAGGTLVALALLLGAACGGDDESPPPPVETETPVARVEITVEYPGAREESIVAAVHFWVLRLDEDSEVTCAKLVGGEDDPYDMSLVRLADGVSTDTAELLASDDVELGPALAHVEATDFTGHPEFAGCIEIDVVQPITTATITLQKANVFDCADPATEEGAPCDDGLICTVGERCDGGQCDPAAPRDCTHVADQCNSESCNEQLGCIASPIADNTPCDDGLYCTDGDVCQVGECVGSARDCTIGAGPCDQVVECNEFSDQCVLQTAPNGTFCDDGFFCNGTETCSFAVCTNSTGPPCPGPDGDADCQESCDEVLDNCLANDLDTSLCADDGVFCNGPETCTTGICGTTMGDPCPGPDLDADCFETCDDVADDCLGQDPEFSVCDDANPLTSNDQCDAAGVCAGS